MSIATLLTHRATVERSAEEMIEGSPVLSWSVVLVRCPVLFSQDSAEDDPAWTASQRHEADIRATVFALPSTDIRPGDRLHFTRPLLPDTYEVLPDPSTVLTLHTASHRELKVRSVG